MKEMKTFEGYEIVDAQGRENLTKHNTATDAHADIRALITALPKFTISVVDALPTEDISTTTVYLVKSGDDSNNLYTEYIYANGVWEILGTQALDIPTKFSDLEQDSLNVESEGYIGIHSTGDNDMGISAAEGIEIEGKGYGVAVMGTSNKGTDSEVTGRIKVGMTNGVDITSPQKVVVTGTKGVKIETSDELNMYASSSIYLNAVDDSIVQLNGAGGVEIYAEDFGTWIRGKRDPGEESETSGGIMVGDNDGVGVSITSPQKVVVNGTNGVEIKSDEGNVKIDSFAFLVDAEDEVCIASHSMMTIINDNGAIEIATPSGEICLIGSSVTIDSDENIKTYSPVEFVKGGLIIPSSTPGSTKKFKISVDDSGTITATEVTV